MKPERVGLKLGPHHPEYLIYDNNRYPGSGERGSWLRRTRVGDQGPIEKRAVVPKMGIRIQQHSI